jgi:hypothetical protein
MSNVKVTSPTAHTLVAQVQLAFPRHLSRNVSCMHSCVHASAMSRPAHVSLQPTVAVCVRGGAYTQMKRHVRLFRLPAQARAHVVPRPLCKSVLSSPSCPLCVTLHFPPSFKSLPLTPPPAPVRVLRALHAPPLPPLRLALSYPSYFA